MLIFNPILDWVSPTVASQSDNAREKFSSQLVSSFLEILLEEDEGKHRSSVSAKNSKYLDLKRKEKNGVKESLAEKEVSREFGYEFCTDFWWASCEPW